MTLTKCLFFVLFVTIVKSIAGSPAETNCTSVESIDGTVGVDCVPTNKSDAKFEPTIIQQHYVDLFGRAKRDVANNTSTTTTTTTTTTTVVQKFPSAQVSELFIQNLAVMNEANMSDCMDRVNCEEKCQLIANGVFRESPDDTRELEGLQDLPLFVRTFYEAGKKGIELGRDKRCDTCQQVFAKCTPMQYDYTVQTNALYKELIAKNITIFDERAAQQDMPSEMVYLHNSMRFLDLANLSTCYARVSCESTCFHIKREPNSEPPTDKSPLLVNDPNKPASVDIIHGGILFGYNLAFNGVCESCAVRYSDCAPDRYSIARMSLALFN